MRYLKASEPVELPENYKPTREEQKFARALAKSDGNISSAARQVRCSRRTANYKIKASPYLQNVVAECRDRLLDDGESALAKGVRNGEGWAVCFLLKTLGKGRGYVDRAELNISGQVMTVADLVRNAALLEAGNPDDDDAIDGEVIG